MAKWTEEEIELLKNSNDKTADELAEILDKTKGQIQTKARSLKVKLLPKGSVVWTEEEIKILKKSKNKTAKEISALIPKSESQIRLKANELGIKIDTIRINWTRKKDKYLKDNFNKLSYTEMARILDVSVSTVISRCKKLGLNVVITPRNDWTKEEEDLLIEYSKIYFVDEIVEKMNRNRNSIIHKAQRLHLKLKYKEELWTPEKIKYLIDNINKVPISQIEKEIGVYYTSIIQKCDELGLKYKSGRWKKYEINILKQNVKKCSMEQLMRLLPGRSKSAIKSKIFDLNLEKIPYCTDLNEEQIQFLLDNYDTMTITNIAKQLNVSYSVVQRIRKKLNLPDKGQTKKWTDELIENLRIDAKTMSRKELSLKYKSSPAQISSVASKNNIKLKDSKLIWTEEKSKELFKLIEEGKKLDELSKILELTESQITNYLKRCNFDTSKLRKRKNWSKEELKILKDNEGKTASQISKIIDRTPDQISQKACKLGIKLQSEKEVVWTQEKIDELKELSIKYPLYKVANILNMNPYSVSKKAKELGLKFKPDKYKPWTEEEIKKLKQISKDYEISELSKIFDRSRASVEGKINELNLEKKKSSKHWTKEETEKLIELSKDHSINEISKIFGKTQSAIITKLSKLNITIKKDYNRRWTNEEEEFLIKNINILSINEIATKLSRSETGIIMRARKLKLKIESETHKQWDEDDIYFLKKNYDKMSIPELCKILNRSESAVKNKAYTLNLERDVDFNKNGYSIPYICENLGITRITLTTIWPSIGLIIDEEEVSEYRKYMYVTRENLMRFLKEHQDIYYADRIKYHAFGEEPEWLKEKIRNDSIKERKQVDYMREKYLFEESKENQEEDYDKEFEDYMKLFNSEIFRIIMSTEAPLEQKIYLLKFGFINNRCYSDKAIAKKLNIDEKYVKLTLKKVLIEYKSIIMNHIKSKEKILTKKIV